MRLQIGTARRECPQLGASIEYVSGSGDDVEVKIVLNDGRAIWLKFDQSARGGVDALIGRATADGQGDGHPVFDAENLRRVEAMREAAKRTEYSGTVSADGRVTGLIDE